VSRLVIDASVAIKWVVEEEGTAAALALRRQNLSAPDLINAECANILWKKTRLGEFSAEEAAFAARLLAAAEIDLIPTRSLLEAALEIAVGLDHPAYDCLYLALAEERDGRLVTADRRLIRRTEESARFRQRVMAL
jgi:predicted nucleic acid-binding protein